MNFKEFMKIVDNRLLEMMDQEKVDWIHESARKQTESQREIFLESLQNQSLPNKKTSELLISTSAIENWLVKIEEQEIFFDCLYDAAHGRDY